MTKKFYVMNLEGSLLPPETLAITVSYQDKRAYDNEGIYFNMILAPRENEFLFRDTVTDNFFFKKCLTCERKEEKFCVGGVHQLNIGACSVYDKGSFETMTTHTKELVSSIFRMRLYPGSGRYSYYMLQEYDGEIVYAPYMLGNVDSSGFFCRGSTSVNTASVGTAYLSLMSAIWNHDLIDRSYNSRYGEWIRSHTPDFQDKVYGIDRSRREGSLAYNWKDAGKFFSPASTVGESNHLAVSEKPFTKILIIYSEASDTYTFGNRHSADERAFYPFIDASRDFCPHVLVGFYNPEDERVWFNEDSFSASIPELEALYAGYREAGPALNLLESNNNNNT